MYRTQQQNKMRTSTKRSYKKLPFTQKTNWQPQITKYKGNIYAARKGQTVLDKAQITETQIDMNVSLL